MNIRVKTLSALVWLTPGLLFAADFVYRPAVVTPPEPPREFRAAWVVTLNVTNVDWPPRPGLTVAEQKAGLISLLDRAVELKLNAVLFQVRPASDALYASPIEPWSEYLTGTQGRAPAPLYDPLAFALAEAHRRGLELHAWFNPFRARDTQSKSPVALNHISRTHPELVRQYGTQLLLDPGEPAAREFVRRVVMDVVRRYDVDGVVFDDHFYPYPEKDAAGRTLDFPDDATWRKYGGGLSRDEWRRQNINQFVHGVYQNIKAAKPWVKFGISPFGIWRPGFPKPVKGLDAYASLCADSRLWLASGWVDYFSPQLYWPVDSPQQSFPALLNWWSAQNVKGRHLWLALDAAGAGQKFSANEIGRQIEITRAQPGAGGEIFFHLRNLLLNSALRETVRAQYAQAALVPASPWLDSTPPGKPALVVANNRSNVSLRWSTAGGKPAWLWVLQFQTDQVWRTKILPADSTAWTFENSKPDAISIRAVDRVGNESPPAAVLLKKVVPPLHVPRGQ